MSIRFILEKNKIFDNEKNKKYVRGDEDDWEKIVILLNSLENKKNKSINMYNNIKETLLEEYDEYNDYIDEYNLIKIDILMDLIAKVGLDID